MKLFRFSPLVLALVLAACGSGESAHAPKAREISRDTACSLDGMTLADFPGPKAQIHYLSGDPDFFCDTVELFAIYLKPEQQKRVTALFVQDMAQADWNHPSDHWIDARSAWYVVGSKARGSMGGTFASFAREENAKAFAGREGGRIYRFSDITPELAQLDGGVLKDQRM